MEVEPIPTYLPLISKNVARKSEAIQKDTNFLDDKDINVSCVSEKKLERYKQDHLYILMETLLTVDDLSLASDKIKSDQFQIFALKALYFVLTRKSDRRLPLWVSNSIKNYKTSNYVLETRRSENPALSLPLL